MSNCYGVVLFEEINTNNGSYILFNRYRCAKKKGWEILTFLKCL